MIGGRTQGKSFVMLTILALEAKKHKKINYKTIHTAMYEDYLNKFFPHLLVECYKDMVMVDYPACDR